MPTEDNIHPDLERRGRYRTDQEREDYEEDNPSEGIVNVVFPVQMYVKVNVRTGEVLSTTVQTPNVSTMSQVHQLEVQTEDWRTVDDAEVITEAIILLDNNEWPDPELVA